MGGDKWKSSVGASFLFGNVCNNPAGGGGHQLTLPGDTARFAQFRSVPIRGSTKPQGDFTCHLSISAQATSTHISQHAKKRRVPSLLSSSFFLNTPPGRAHSAHVPLAGKQDQAHYLVLARESGPGSRDAGRSKKQDPRRRR